MSATPAPTNVCPQCGAQFRCGMEGGDQECWCATLPPLLPVPATSHAGPTAASCLCPACLKARLVAAATESCPTPQLTEARRSATVTVDAINEHGEVVPTRIPGERPLTLYLDKREIVTLMTLGAAPEALVLGYLRNQRLVSRLEDIAAVQVDWETDSAAVTTRNGNADVEKRLERRTITSGCGQGTMFGDLMESLDEIALPDDGCLNTATLAALLDNVRRQDSIYKEAGAVHGCALAAADGEILMFVEDVGRHNAVDAIAGQMWLKNMGGGDKIFYTTGRLTSEMVIKTAQMGIPFIVSRSGLTEMGHAIARKIGLTVIGRATGKHYLLFTGQHRFRNDGVQGKT